MEFQNKQVPLVSVVMPAWNSGRTIRDAIESVLKQTFTDFELVVCDDFSQDDTQEVLSSIIDSRLRVIRNIANSGPGGARDRAIAEARGKWLAVIDADDAWHPNRLEKLISAAGSREDIMVFDDIFECHDSPEGLVQWRRLRGKRTFGGNGKSPLYVAFKDYIRQRNLLIKPLFPAWVVHNNALAHTARRFGEDTEFFLRIIGFGLHIVYVPEAMYLYRITPGSMSANPQRSELMLEVLTRAREHMPLTNSDLKSLEGKIASVQTEIQYSPFLQAVKTRQWRTIFSLLRKHPGLLLQFLARLRVSIPYQLHRLAHQAKGR